MGSLVATVSPTGAQRIGRHRSQVTTVPPVERRITHPIRNPRVWLMMMPRMQPIRELLSRVSRQGPELKRPRDDGTLGVTEGGESPVPEQPPSGGADALAKSHHRKFLTADPSGDISQAPTRSNSLLLIVKLFLPRTYFRNQQPPNSRTIIKRPTTVLQPPSRQRGAYRHTVASRHSPGFTRCHNLDWKLEARAQLPFSPCCCHC